MINYTISKSRALYKRASQIIVGGVNSPARAFLSVGGDPLFAEHAHGCHLWDADGNRYIDYICSWGPLIAGHAHPEVIKALNHAAARGTSFGMSTEIEILLAEKIRSMMPSIEMIRMVNSGTEATMSAIRLARGYTGKRKIIKFAGCYHGHGDSFLIKAGSGAMTLGVPDSAGITPGTSADTLIADFNNLSQVAELVTANKGEIAAIIVEPVAGNMGTVIPAPGFLKGLREITIRERIILIFDEVMTGFRLAMGGAQELYNVIPDLTTLGKIVGGGLPVGAYGGRAEIMSILAPLGPVYQAGTLSGNPLAMAAGLATLSLINNKTYIELETTGNRLASGISKAAENSGIPFTLNRCGSMFTPFFTSYPVTDFISASRSDLSKYATFFHGMLKRGVLLPPSQFETAFISTVHDDEAVNETIRAAEDTIGSI